MPGGHQHRVVAPGVEPAEGAVSDTAVADYLAPGGGAGAEIGELLPVLGNGGRGR